MSVEVVAVVAAAVGWLVGWLVALSWSTDEQTNGTRKKREREEEQVRKGV